MILSIRGKADDRYRYALVIGYRIFYTFLICTTDSPIAFTYIGVSTSEETGVIRQSAQAGPFPCLLRASRAGKAEVPLCLPGLFPGTFRQGLP